MKHASDMLIRNGRVWVSANSGVIEDGSVLIRDGRIARVGDFRARADIIIDADGCLVMPGFIQSHVHLCQTLFRGAGENRPLLPWLSETIWPLEAAHDAASIRTSSLLACAEMIRGGVTAFLSMETVRHTGHIFEAVEETGLMGMIGHCFMDDSCRFPPLAVDIEDYLADCDVLWERWREHESLRLAVAPRFALSCRGDNLRDVAAYARERGLRLHTHSSEQKAEVELLRERTGMHNIEYLHSLGLTGSDVGLAHCIWTRQNEIQLLRETETHVLHCPTANMKLGSGIAPVVEYLQAGMNVGLGSDGAACNNRLDMFGEMRQAALLQKLRAGPESFSAETTVELATLGGARSLGWEAEMGSLEVGRRANIILVDQSGSHILPSDDPAVSLVYANQSSDVVMTIVNGRILYEDGELTTIDEAGLRAEARLQYGKLRERCACLE